MIGSKSTVGETLKGIWGALQKLEKIMLMLFLVLFYECLMHFRLYDCFLPSEKYNKTVQ